MKLKKPLRMDESPEILGDNPVDNAPVRESALARLIVRQSWMRYPTGYSMDTGTKFRVLRFRQICKPIWKVIHSPIRNLWISPVPLRSLRMAQDRSDPHCGTATHIDPSQALTEKPVDNCLFLWITGVTDDHP